MKVFSALLLAFFIYFIGFQQACSHVMYTDVNLRSCDEFPAQSRCKRVKIPNPREPGGGSDYDYDDYGNNDRASNSDLWKYEYEMSLGELEIVFVLDNSGSMAIEHRNLASQLSQFLKDMKYLDYRFALITTDISSSPNNPVRGASYQDGKFIRIGGRLFLSNESLGQSPSPSVLEDFKQALTREETKRCDMKNQPDNSSSRAQYDRLYEEHSNTQTDRSCPSSDERGTYAINLALQNPSHRSFFAPDTHTMFVIISDEDVRSGREFIEQFDGLYDFEYKDTPESIAENLQRLFPHKTASFHPIIIIPGDSSCLAKQNRYYNRGPGSGRGYYGREYGLLADARDELRSYENILTGSKISICDRNYRSQLKKIALFAERMRIPLPCFESQLEDVTLRVNGKIVRSKTEIEERNLFITARKDLAISSRVKVEVVCREN